MPSKEKPKGKTLKYKQSMCYAVYDLAKSGHNLSSMANAIGVSLMTFSDWMKRFKSLRLAVEIGTKLHDDVKRTESFYEFVVGRLPEDLVDLWNELMDSQGDPSAIKRLDRMIETHGKKARQRLFLHALVFCDFNVGKACTFVNITYQHFNIWKAKDVDFARLINEVIERKKDFVEGALLKLVRQGVPLAVVHANKTLNADRGYSTKVEVRHTGSIDVNLRTVPVANLPVTMEMKKHLLEAIRRLRQEQETDVNGPKPGVQVLEHRS